MEHTVILTHLRSYSTSVIVLAFVFLLIRRLMRSFFKPIEFPGSIATGPYAGRKGLEDKVPPIFPNGWFPLKESVDVTIGKIAQVQALGENFVVFRGENGVATVADAWCPHLGANLAGGAVVGNCVRCPFHHWTFDGENGECTSIPYAEKIPGVAKLKIWKSAEVNGCIFVWYHADGEEPTWFPTTLKEIENGEISLVASHHVSLTVHIQDIYENLADFAHFIYIHGPGILSGTKKGFYDSFLNKLMWLHFDEIDWQASEEESTKHESYVRIKERMSFFNSIYTQQFEFTIRNVGQMGPGLGYGTIDIPRLGKLVLELLYLPVAPFKVASCLRVYGQPSLRMSLSMPLLMMNVNTMVMRDSEIWKDKCYQDRPVLAKGERISQFRRWYGQFYSKSSPKLTNWTKSIDW